jgi:anti-sigma B factor antagonist
MQPESTPFTEMVPPTRRRLELRRHTPESDVVVLAITGEVDLGSAPALKTALNELLTDTPQRGIILDFSGLSHLDSTGLAVFIGFRRRLHPGRRLLVAAASPYVMRLLKLTGLDGAFDTFASVTDALLYLDDGDAGDGSLRLSPDAAMVLGLAATALPFAESPAAEAESWRRILLPQGGPTVVAQPDDAARELPALRAEGTLAKPSSAATPDAQRRRLDSVVARATRIAAERGGSSVRTGDVVRGVMAVYGVEFERALQAASDDDAVDERG